MTAAAPVRVGVRGSTRISQEGLVRSIAAIDGIAVVAQAERPGTTDCDLDGVPTDVCVLELDRPAILPVLTAHRRSIGSPVVVVVDPAVAAVALRSGAAAAVAPDDGIQTLGRAIRHAAEGRRWLSPTVAAAIAEDLTGSGGRVGDLSPRELEVLVALGRGAAAKTVAAGLGMSVSSVNTYRGRIERKLGIDGIPGLIRYAVEHGLVR